MYPIILGYFQVFHRVDLPPFEKECLFFFLFVLEVSLPFLFISWQTFFFKTPTKILHYLFSYSILLVLIKSLIIFLSYYNSIILPVLALLWIASHICVETSASSPEGYAPSKSFNFVPFFIWLTRSKK